MVQRCAILIPREAPPGSYDLALSLAKKSDSENFLGEIIHIEEGALILSAD